MMSFALLSLALIGAPMDHGKTKTVAILMFEGVQIIDFSGPYEVFGQAHFDVFTVAATREPLTTSMGLQIVPRYSFADAPKADIVVLPGGDVDVENRAIIDWVRARAPSAEVVLSVCNGALWLAKAGLLDGLTATTFHGSIRELEMSAPKTRVVRDQRFVDNGKIVTSAGLTSGIDGAMHVISKLLGVDKAKEVALHLEYDWRPESKYARANLADHHLPDLDLGSDVRFRVTRSIGDADRWTFEGTMDTKTPPSALIDRISKQLEEKGKWRPTAKQDSAAPTRTWTFSDESGRPWRAVAVFEPKSGASIATKLTLERI